MQREHITVGTIMWKRSSVKDLPPGKPAATPGKVRPWEKHHFPLGELAVCPSLHPAFN